jgi:glycosyltransferase involved in cell wall biosynthesis
LSRPLSVGLDLVFLGERAGGAGRYARELVPALLATEPGLRLHAFVSRDLPRDLLAEPWARDVRWERLPVGLSGPPWHLAAQFGAIPALAIARRLDVVHGLANVVPVHIPRVRSIVTLLDLIWLHVGEAWGARRAVRSTRRLSLFCARNADRVLAISHEAARDFSRTVQLDPARIDVAPLGVSERDFATPAPEEALRSRLDLGPGPVVLCVAQKRPYKNQAALVRALAELDDRVRLVLPGEPTAYEDELRALAGEVGVAQRVRLPGWVDESELEGLYRLATCVVLPSLIEGFGLPVLEAMRRGVPVACAERGALGEVAGDAALLFDPEDQTAVTTAVRRLLDDPLLRAELARRGRERVAEFSWLRTAELTLESYRHAAAGARR